MRLFLLHLLCLGVIALSSIVNASPTPIRELPSITYDTLEGYKDPDKEEDQHVDSKVSESESAPVGPITGTRAGYMVYELVRSMLREQDDPTTMLSYYLSPRRVVRRMADGVQTVGSFGSMFATGFQKSLHALSTEMKERIIPEAGNLFGVWTIPPKVEESGWMEGI